MRKLRRIPKDIASFRRCLNEVIARIETSDGSMWANLSREEVCVDLRSAINDVESGIGFDVKHLEMLFAPTGPIQDISTDNGWGDEFLTCASDYDRVSKDY
ncbi:hypothetical protein [Ruficoccus sp. ZRK36]|uniref:hypothetical protein n=1 Tax=Ruficoccus sp. ZRK36 TaxID=2866311 RepID=UPI001C7386E6|nr:hypothetical protein [Ruficoccus sp. ZRK36]QYY36292.1 hypothetical protein K0V07_02220 [Ruficoccus sp. ZRK36]